MELWGLILCGPNHVGAERNKIRQRCGYQATGEESQGAALLKKMVRYQNIYNQGNQ